jgi:hypothetical protein
MYIKDADDHDTLESFLLQHTNHKIQLDRQSKGKPIITPIEKLNQKIYLNLKSTNNLLLNQNRGAFKKHYSFIKRFTFNTL